MSAAPSLGGNFQFKRSIWRAFGSTDCQSRICKATERTILIGPPARHTRRLASSVPRMRSVSVKLTAFSDMRAMIDGCDPHRAHLVARGNTGGGFSEVRVRMRPVPSFQTYERTPRRYLLERFDGKDFASVRERYRSRPVATVISAGHLGIIA